MVLDVSACRVLQHIVYVGRLECVQDGVCEEKRQSEKNKIVIDQQAIDSAQASEDPERGECHTQRKAGPYHGDQAPL